MSIFQYLLSVINVAGYNKGDGVIRLKEKLSLIYKTQNIYITKNGRSAIYLFLKSLNLPSNTQVAIQAFTCNAVVNPIMSLGLTPLYIDIKEDTFSMDIKDLEKKINENVKVLILQHSFGIRADEKIYDFCKQKGIVVLNDAAHCLGDSEIAHNGDATMLSFGLEKMIPSRVGGALLVNNPQLIDKVSSMYNESNYIPKKETFKWLINPILWRILRITRVSDSFIYWLKKKGVLISGFEKGESEGIANYSSLQSIPPVLAKVVLVCLSDLKTNLNHRKAISDIYSSRLTQKYSNCKVRYPYITSTTDQRDLMIKFLESLGYPMADRWYFPVIFPKSTNLIAMKYIQGSCPKAESISEHIVNLPTNQSVTTEIAHLICDWIENNCNNGDK